MTCGWHPPGARCERQPAGQARLGRFTGAVCHRHLLRLQFVAALLRYRMHLQPTTGATA